MGQYYMPCILKENWKRCSRPVEISLCSHDYGNGLKLMEHSYVGNRFVNAVEHVIARFGYDRPFVWCGDYADTVKCRGRQVDIYSEGSKASDERKADVASATEGKNLSVSPYRYIVNFTKNQYVRVPEREDGVWKVHPLPLLCCDGNGRGGGDYGIEDSRVGSWAYDRIAVTNDDSLLDGMDEIDGVFELDW